MKSERRQTYAIGIVGLQQAHALKCVMAGGLTAINMENFACDELCSVEVHHRVNDIRGLSHPPHWMQRRQSLMGLDLVHRGFDNSRRNSIHAHVTLRVFDRE